jgi:phasin family protein
MAKSGMYGEDFDFSKMMDFSRIAADFRMPGLDMSALMESQRRNLDALTQANRRAVEGMQAVAKRQAEIMRQMMEEASGAMREVMAAGSPEDKASRQAEIAKAAFQRALANMRELADMVTQSNQEAFEVINKRVAESLDELKGIMAKPAKK